MDGNDVSTSPIRRLAAYVRRAALAAGYDIDRPNSGAKKRLANAAGMSETSVSRLLSGERMPDARYFEPLAQALHVDPIDLLVESEILRPETRTHELHEPVASTPITPDQVAAQWGITDPDGLTLVRAMHARLTRPKPPTEEDDTGSAQAQ